MPLFKILRSDEWASLAGAGSTPGSADDVEDGYVHLAAASQIEGVAQRRFADEDGLLLLELCEDALGPQLRWEPSSGGEDFPHLYRELRIADLHAVAPLPLEGGVHAFPESVAGRVDPTRAQFDAFKALDRDHPLDMLNLVRLREEAVYPAGHPLADAGLSGAEAYRRYGTDTATIIARLGVEIVWRGEFQSTLIGPQGEAWNHAFVARYPAAHAFLEMVVDPAYREAVKHRQAAVETSRLIRCRPAEAGAAFG